MKINQTIIAVALTTFVFSACNNDPIQLSESSDQALNGKRSIHASLSGAQRGRVLIKVSAETANKVALKSGGQIELSSLPSALDRSFQKIRTTRVTRLFPHAGKYEERSVREGLNRWYQVEFDPSLSVDDAMTSLASVKDVHLVEPVLTMEPSAAPVDFTAPVFKRENTLPFNDPELKNQWHYNNVGTVPPGTVMGADINLFKAWEITKGKPNVVVCVVDGGVDVTHPDLKESIWVNEREKNGQPGVDDDGNGFIDDVNGYCFVVKTPDVKSDPDGHGTHVAGTIAARNNNGIGVCGVAGGDGTPNSGARIMSAAIFREGIKFDGDAAAAIKYGADNGAVISQNSWSYPPTTGIFEIPQSLKEAIDYFVKYAGCDNDGNQLPNSPMKGGVVFVAAGNFAHEYTAQPASYENVIAVAATGTNFEKATYSNYGDWVDIAAPGGDQERYANEEKAGVLSTVCPTAEKTNGREYAYYEGTSMACPHVSGIAALVLSHKGGYGYTNEMLKQQILASVYPIDINEVNPFYSGKLGAGSIDAYAALTLENKNIAPEKPKFDEVKTNKETKYTQAEVFWTIPKDADDGAPMYFQLYYSDKPLNESNYKEATSLGNIKKQIPSNGHAAGEEMSYLVNALKPSTTYYFALVAVDRWGLRSNVSFFSTETKKNDPPQVLNLPQQPIKILNNEVFEYAFNVADPNGHKWTYKLTGETSGFTHSRNGDNIDLRIRPVQGEGEHSFTITLTDELSTAESYVVRYRIVSIKEPVLKTPITPQMMGVKNGELAIELAQHFEAQDELTHTYSATVADQSIAAVAVDANGKMTIKANRSGKTNVTVEVSNGFKKTRTTFELVVVDDLNKDIYAVWPLPIKKEVNIWLNAKHTTAQLQMLSPAGEVVFSQQIEPNASGIAVVNLSQLAPGSYTLRVKAGEKPFVKAVLKR